MKNEKIRALTLIVALVAIISAGVVLIRTPLTTPMASFSERINLGGEASGDRQKSGLELRLRKEGVSLLIPNCDMSGWQSKFFMHVYPATDQGEISTAFIGRDFDLSTEPAQRISTHSGLACVVDRPFDVPNTKEVVIGQFTTPAGRCCQIIWSRAFVIEN